MLRRYFAYFHGLGDENQYDIYRCCDCRRLVTWTQIRTGKRCCSGHVVPTMPRFTEVVRLFLLPWTF